MQNEPTSAALAWARMGRRRIALIAASLVLALALIASLGSPSSSASVDTGAGDGTELVAGKWTSTKDDSIGPWVGETMNYRAGPSWT